MKAAGNYLWNEELRPVPTNPMSILVVGITYRTINNYLPALDCLAAQGHNVSLLLFPSLSDPDSENLSKLGFPVAAIHPINYKMYEQGVDPILNEKKLDSLLDGVFSTQHVDVVLLTTCHLYPETHIHSWIHSGFVKSDRRPLTIGLQHGFFQFWESYFQNFVFDHLAVWGQGFVDLFPQGQSKVIVGGLPKLDLLPNRWQSPSSLEASTILFCGQHVHEPEQIADFLLEMKNATGMNVAIKPHPEHVSCFDSLKPAFQFIAPTEALATCLASAAMIISSSSTAIIESLVAGVPAIVLADGRHQLFESAGIVVHEFSVEMALESLREQAQPSGRRRIEEFLQRYLSCQNVPHAEHFAAVLHNLVANHRSPASIECSAL